MAAKHPLYETYTKLFGTTPDGTPVNEVHDNGIELRDTKSPFIAAILKHVTPLILKIVDGAEEYAIKDGRTFTDYDRKMTALGVQHDLLKSLEKYTLPSDAVEYIKARHSKGAIEIEAVVGRDGDRHNFNTQIIYAGGYHIQKLHLRYLTKTSLPQTSNDVETKRIKQEIAKLTKAEKLQREIYYYELRIQKNKDTIAANKDKTDQEIYDIITSPEYGRTPESQGMYQFKVYTWDEVPHKNFNNDENEFNRSNEEYKLKAIDSWKHRYITRPAKDIAMFTKEIEKLQKKLDAL